MTASANPEVAELLSAYDLMGEIGRGSWGVVLRARHRQLGREVAVKQLPVEFSAQADVRRRFVHEARLLASLDHPHIVPVYDYIEKEGVCLLIMEYLPGGTVWDGFNTEGFNYLDSAAIALATCAALHFAHRRAVLHRDVKPENLMFAGSGILKVTDFGIAKMLGAASTMGTRAGEVLGSPAYIAPEQATGAELGPYTDVYATATVVYELLSGRLPFPDEGDPLMVMYRHVHEAPRPLQEVAPEVPEPIAQVVMYALATSRQERYQTAEEFGVALAEASTASFGAGWLRRSSVQVAGGGSIIAAAERASFSIENLAPKSIRVDEELVSESGMPTFATPPAPGTQAAPRTVVEADAGPQGNRKLATISAAVALVLAVLAMGLTFFGPSKPAPSAAPANRGGLSLSVQGTPVGDETVTVDFDRPVDIRIEPPPGSPLGIPKSSKLVATASLPGGISVPLRSQLATGDGDAIVFVFEGRQFKYLVAGKTTLYLRLETADPATTLTAPAELQGLAVQVEPAKKTLFAIPTIAAGLVLLGVFAYAEALILPLRRANKRLGPIVGLGVLGIVAGAALGTLGWALSSVDPSGLLTGVEVFLLGGAGVAAGLWAYHTPPKERAPHAGAAPQRTAV